MDMLGRTQLRRFGNSTGMVVPKAVLAALDAKDGDAFELSVEDGRLVAARAGQMVDGSFVSATELAALEAIADELQAMGERMNKKIDAAARTLDRLSDPSREAALRQRLIAELKGEAEDLSYGLFA